MQGISSKHVSIHRGRATLLKETCFHVNRVLNLNKCVCWSRDAEQLHNVNLENRVSTSTRILTANESLPDPTAAV